MILEIEAGSGVNGCGCEFRPLTRGLRGRMDFAKLRHPKAHERMGDFPTGVPGQRVRIDTERLEGRMVEPLRQPAHEPTWRKVQEVFGGKDALGLGGALTLDDDVTVRLRAEDVPTWLFWMRRAVESGAARVVEGELPTDAQCKGARKRFHVTEQVNRVADLMEEQVCIALATMTPQQRKEYDRIKAERGTR